MNCKHNALFQKKQNITEINRRRPVFFIFENDEEGTIEKTNYKLNFLCAAQHQELHNTSLENIIY